MQQLTLVSGVTQLYPPPRITTVVPNTTAANWNGGYSAGAKVDEREGGFDAQRTDEYDYYNGNDDQNDVLSVVDEDEVDDDSIVYSDGGGDGDDNGNGTDEAEGADGDGGGDDDGWGSNNGYVPSPAPYPAIVAAYQNYNPLTDPWFVSAIAPAKSAVILLDTSGSMRGEPATLAKQMATVLLRSFTSSDRVAVLQYNGTEATALGPHGLELVPALAAFTDDIAASIASIDPYKMRGRSYISSALEEGYVESMRLICTTSLTSVRPRVHASTHRRLQHSTR